MSQVVSQSFYTSVAVTLLQLGFDHRVAIVLMAIDYLKIFFVLFVIIPAVMDGVGMLD